MKNNLKPKYVYFIYSNVVDFFGQRLGHILRVNKTLSGVQKGVGSLYAAKNT